MSFWKKHKSKILIGGALLTIATGALGILVKEETRLKRKIVGCERIIVKETQQLPPKGMRIQDKEEKENLTKIEQAVEEKEDLQKKKERIEQGKIEIEHIVGGLKNIERIIGDSEELHGREAIDINKIREEHRELLLILEKMVRFSDKDVKQFFEIMSKKGSDKYKELKALGLELGEEYDNKHNLMYEISGRLSNAKNKDREALLGIVYQEVINAFRKTMTGFIWNVKEKITRWAKESDELMKLSNSGELRETLAQFTPRINEVNDKIGTYEEGIDGLIEEIRGDIKRLKAEARRIAGVEILDDMGADFEEGFEHKEE